MRKNTKNIAWIKMPVTLTDDERIAELVAKKGMAGLGVYNYIICEMYRRKSRCLTMTQLKAMSVKGATQKTVLAVVDEFGLFRKDKMGHVYSAIDYLGFDDEINDDDNPSTCSGQADDDNIFNRDTNTIGFESPSIPSPARVNNKDIDEDKDHHNDGADYIMQIPEHSQWTEVALMKSGFGMLIKRNWQVTLDLFRNHAIANCTIGQIHSVDDAKKYFHFYVTNPTSGSMLRKALEDYERQHPLQNPYRFEDVNSANDHRSYHGIPIPDNAPPRPDERADWDYENECWISPANFDQKN